MTNKNSSNIPVKELEKLLSIPYTKTTYPRLLAYKNLGFAKDAIQEIREELKDRLTKPRKDAQKNVDHAFRLIVCNLVASVFERRALSISGANKSYNKGTHLNRLFLTYESVNTVIKALTPKYITKLRGSKHKKRVNNYRPTPFLETKLIPLIYEISEEYSEDTQLVIFKPPLGEEEINNREEHTMWRSSELIKIDETHSDNVNLRRINNALKDASYALKSPVKRIYSYNDPMKGGRLYVRLQNLLDRRARIRINTLFNGEPIVEVDLSANHPRMLAALDGYELPENFYDEIAEESKTKRDQVKFLFMKAIGAKNRSISLSLEEDEKDWFKSTFIMSQKNRRDIEKVIAKNYPKLNLWLYKGKGINLQTLEGDILMKAMLSLLDKKILSLPIFDALYVQEKNAEEAKAVLENAWKEILDVSFKPYTKIDKAN
jgi:hypothetical protein